VLKCAQEELKKRILKDTMTCNKILCWALTEPENGSDASGLTTKATKVEGGYLING
jgi:acyl-CoA oxidase